jgi:hypothetical protein
MNAPPSSPRRRRWLPPAIGTRYRRLEDGSAWRVVNLHRRDRQVELVCEDDPTVRGRPTEQQLASWFVEIES